VESRTGANISEEELIALDEFVSPLLRQGQSPHHIVANNPDQFNVSEKSIYRYVAGNLLSAKNIDLPRVVRLKPRKSKPVQHKVDSACRIGRTYHEFLRLVEEKDPHVVEMDSVIGRVGGKVLLTLMFKSCDFMIAFLRDRNTSQSVIDRFDWMYEEFGAIAFRVMFQALLGDNGSEFSNPKALEFDAKGNRRASLYYCDPMQSNQKPHVELGHEFIRRILPKGSSFDHLVQVDINLMMSHINSYSREKLNDKAPIDIFAAIYGSKVIDKLGYRRIPANEIILKPSLLKRAHATPVEAGSELSESCNP
jgi:IS30 family transposase